MSERGPWSAIVRREWEIVVACVVVAALVGGGSVLLRKHDVASATTRVLLAQRLLTEFPEIPIADEVAAAVRLNVSRIASDAGLPATAAPTIKVTLEAAPFYGVDVEATAPDKRTAAAISKAAARVTVQLARERMASVLERYRERIAADKSALAVLDAAAASPSGAASTDVAFKLWSVKTAYADDQNALSQLQDAYSIYGPPITQIESRKASAVQSAAGAAVVGLLIGVALSMLRERFAVRRA